MRGTGNPESTVPLLTSILLLCLVFLGELYFLPMVFCRLQPAQHLPGSSIPLSVNRTFLWFWIRWAIIPQCCLFLPLVFRRYTLQRTRRLERQYPSAEAFLNAHSASMLLLLCALLLFHLIAYFHLHRAILRISFSFYVAVMYLQILSSLFAYSLLVTISRLFSRKSGLYTRIGLPLLLLFAVPIYLGEVPGLSLLRAVSPLYYSLFILLPISHPFLQFAHSACIQIFSITGLNLLILWYNTARRHT